MKCGVCNTENSNEAVFCVSCGALLSSAQSVPAKQPKKLLTVANPKATLFNALQIFIYLLLAVGSIWMLFGANTIRLQATFDEDVFGSFSFIGVAKGLIGGNDACNPTMLSIIMGMTAIIAAFSSAVCWIAATFTKLLGKFHNETHLVAMILGGINAAVVALLIPLATKLSGVIKPLLAKETNIFIEDIEYIRSIWAIVFAGICIALIVAELILASKEKQEKIKDKRVEK